MIDPGFVVGAYLILVNVGYPVPFKTLEACEIARAQIAQPLRVGMLVHRINGWCVKTGHSEVKDLVKGR